jgi:hypothetical protein
MSDLNEWFSSVGASFAAALDSIGTYLPHLLAALLLVLLGWIVARVLKTGFVKLANSLNAFLYRIRPGSRSGRMQLSAALIALLANVLFWLLILLFAAIAARVARLDLFTDWLDRVVAYLPTLVAGGLIALAGYLASSLIRDLVTATVHSSGARHSEVFGLTAQGAVFLTAAVVGLDQIGVDVTLLIVLLALVIGAALLCLVLAFGFGARVFVGNLIGAQQAQLQLEAGQTAQIDDWIGQVIEVTATSVVLATPRGRLLVPARLFLEKATLLVLEHDDES